MQARGSRPARRKSFRNLTNAQRITGFRRSSGRHFYFGDSEMATEEVKTNPELDALFTQLGCGGFYVQCSDDSTGAGAGLHSRGEAVYCENCEMVPTSTWQRCGLCGSQRIVELAPLFSGPSDPGFQPEPCLQSLSELQHEQSMTSVDRRAVELYRGSLVTQGPSTSCRIWSAA